MHLAYYRYYVAYSRRSLPSLSLIRLRFVVQFDVRKPENVSIAYSEPALGHEYQTLIH